MLTGRFVVGCMLVLGVGCIPIAVPPATPAQPPTYGNRFKVTIVAASVAETKPNGEPWHTKDPDPGIPLLTSLVSLSMSPAAGQLASAVFRDTEAGKAIPPSPVVRVQVGGSVFETATRRASFNPIWEYAFAVDIRDLAPDSPVVMVISDDDGDAPIDQFRSTLGELLGRPDTNLQGESVRALQVRVEPLPDQPSYTAYRFRVPSSETLETLAQRTGGPRFDGDWQPVPVLNSDVVRIRAEGLVQPGTFSSDGCGPAGFRDGRWASYNRADFGDVPHAALVAYLAGSPRYVGRAAEFEVAKAGRLLLGVNDRDVSNNSGFYDVLVEINPPDAVSARSRTPGYVPPAWR